MPRWLPGRQVVVSCAAHNDEYGCKYSDKVLTLSQRDSDYFEKHYGRKADAIIGVGMEDKFQPVDKTIMTGKKPMVVLILNEPEKQMVYFKRVQKIAKKYHFDAEYVTNDILNLDKDGHCNYPKCKCHKAMQHNDMEQNIYLVAYLPTHKY